MDPAPQLPLPLEELPQALHRFCNPDGPVPGRMMAAKGLVPVRGADQVTLLAQLANDADEGVRDAASESLAKLPEAVLAPACSTPELPAAVLHHLCAHLKDDELLGLLSSNPNTTDASLLVLAKRGSEQLCERVATNEARLLRAPEIIEALYKNRNMRMSTADRLVDLAARNGVELTGIPAFKDHVEALQGQLIPEPSEEPLPQDDGFQTTLEAEADAQREDASAFDDEQGMEEMKKSYKPLNMQIMEMSKAEKLRLAMIGSLGARQILVRDHNKQVAMAAITSPQVNAPEAAEVAKSKQVSEEILRFIANKKEWVKTGEVKHNLVFNPKTPPGVSLKFIGHMRMDELKKLAKSRNVPGQIRSLAAQWVARREKKKKR